MKYIGIQNPDNCGPARVLVETNDGRRYPLAPCNDLRNHSPDGFQWGYGGSGPAQLALALLAHQFGADVALRYYQRFKWRVVAKLEGDWELTDREVQDHVAALRAAPVGLQGGRR